MNTFEYTCKQNPTGSIEVANKFANGEIKSADQALKCFNWVMTMADDSTKALLLEEIREIHPDSTLYRDNDGVGFWQMKQVEKAPIVADLPKIVQDPRQMQMATQNNSMLHACGCGGGSMMQAIGSADTKFAEIKAERTTNKKIFNVLISIVVIALAYKILIKK